jgi:phosphoglycolate phosphatase
MTLVGTLDTPSPPHPHKGALIEFLLNEMGASAEESLYVGDRWEDGEAAQYNKMSFIAVGWGYGEWDSVKIRAGW